MPITKVSILLTLGLWPVMCIFLCNEASLCPAWTLHTQLDFIGGLSLQWVAWGEADLNACVWEDCICQNPNAKIASLHKVN